MSVTQPDLPSRQASEWADAFAEICDRHRGRLIRWLTAIFGARDAEDIAQEALTRLYVRPELLDPDADAWPWLAVVARNVGRDMARHNAQSTTVEHEVLAALPGRDSVCDQVVAREDAAKLATALRSLSRRERAVILLRDFEGASIGDIAEVMGLNENAVRQQLFRARRRLGSAYLALGGDRRAGLAALLGLKVRELLRRHSALVESLTGSSATVFAAVVPALAIVLGATFGALPARTPRVGYGATRAAAFTVADDLGRHGLAGRDGRPLYGDGARPAPAGPRNPAPAPHRMIRTRPDVGPVHADAQVSPTPFSEAGGRVDDFEVYVDLPNGWRVRVWGYHDKPPGYGPVCRLHVVPCG